MRLHARSGEGHAIAIATIIDCTWTLAQITRRIHWLCRRLAWFAAATIVVVLLTLAAYVTGSREVLLIALAVSTITTIAAVCVTTVHSFDVVADLARAVPGPCADRGITPGELAARFTSEEARWLEQTINAQGARAVGVVAGPAPTLAERLAVERLAATDESDDEARRASPHRHAHVGGGAS